MAAVALLAELAGPGPALEVGIETGRIAGLRRKGRWGGWGREPIDSCRSAHVSVYGHRAGSG